MIAAETAWAPFTSAREPTCTLCGTAALSGLLHRPYVGPEDTLPTESCAQDFYCAALFRALKYPKGFVGVFGSSASDSRSTLADPRLAATNDHLYAGIYEFARKWTAARGADYPILTGAGPGLMRAANAGAVDAGGASIGYTTYYDPQHNYMQRFKRAPTASSWSLTG